MEISEALDNISIMHDEEIDYTALLTGSRVKSPTADDLERPASLVSEEGKFQEPLMTTPFCTRRLFSDDSQSKEIVSASNDSSNSTSADTLSQINESFLVEEDKTLINYLKENYPEFIPHHYGLRVLARKDLKEEFSSCQLIVLLKVLILSVTHKY